MKKYGKLILSIALMVVIAIVVFFATRPARAETPIPPASTDKISVGDGRRFGWGLEGGLQAYTGAIGSETAQQTGFYTSPFLFWSGGPKFTLAAQHIEDWSRTRDCAVLGVRWGLIGAAQSRDIRVTLGLNGNLYHGNGYDFLIGENPSFKDRLGWGFSLGAGTTLIGISGIKVATSYDMLKNFFTARVGLVLTDTFKH